VALTPEPAPDCPLPARTCARGAKSAAYASAVAEAAGKQSGAGTRQALGIDVGGTGVKAAVVDIDTGALLSRRVRASTPQPSTPDQVAATVRHVIELIAEDYPLPAVLPVGCGLPGVIKRGVVMTAANIDKGWIGTSANETFGTVLSRPVHALNDADAAAIAEDRLGAGHDVHGTVLMLTIGTGIGSGLLVDGRLVPNTEFGHIELKGRDAERQLSGAARERRGLRWKPWAQEFNGYLARIEAYIWPDLIILGGGVSKAIDRYQRWLVSRAPIVPAKFLNTAGIIGAALAAADQASNVEPVGASAVTASAVPSSASA
jgi:polyphosphate glucokinase